MAAIATGDRDEEKTQEESPVVASANAVVNPRNSGLFCE